ncbi:MAG: hypothetical protein BJ554DRAFT_384 [Olpidium bornovanus]|uniref:Response regulatory domain-containing protein n=1 Tax=Olpidium bornovanus TaxID=278681 RepID=A0A8H7ZTC4_9FUNG|nr:MAG: hypothetical protein BJ554DRAFT_384 [Olpidium bornovanus]
MPNLDGISATTRIRQFDRTTPIICVTSSASAQERVIYLTNGMNDVLAKPMSTQGLRSVLAKFCREPLRSGAAPFKVIEDSDCTEGGAAAAALKVIIEEGTEGAGAGAATGEVRKRRPDAAKRPGYQRQTQPAQPVSPLNAEASSPPSTTVSSAAYNVGPTGYPQDLPAGAWEFFGPDSGALSYAAAATAAAAAQQQQQQQRGRHGQWQRQRQHQPQSAQWGLGPAAGGDPPQQQQLLPPPASSPGTLLPPAAAPPAPFSASFAEADHRAKRPKFS